MNRITIISVAVAAAVIALSLIGYGLWKAGGAAEREAVLKQAIENIKKMEEDNAEIKRLSDHDLCREFGFEWLPDEGRCG